MESDSRKKAQTLLQVIGVGDRLEALEKRRRGFIMSDRQ